MQPLRDSGSGRPAAAPTQARLRGLRPVLLYLVALLVVLLVTAGVVIALAPRELPCPPGGACRPVPPVAPPFLPPISRATIPEPAQAPQLLEATVPDPTQAPPLFGAAIPEPTTPPLVPAPEARMGKVWPPEAAPATGPSWSFEYEDYYWTLEPGGTDTEVRLSGKSEIGLGWIRLLVLKRDSSEMDREAMLRALFDRAGTSNDSIAIDQDLLDALRRPTIGYQPALGMVLRGTSTEGGSIGPIAVLSVSASYRGVTLGMQLTIDDPDRAQGAGSVGRRIRVGGGYLDKIVKHVRWPNQ